MTVLTNGINKKKWWRVDILFNYLQLFNVGLSNMSNCVSHNECRVFLLNQNTDYRLSFV